MDELKEDLPGNKRNKKELQDGYDSDSDGQDLESDQESKKSDDMFASDTEETFDMDRFEKEQEIGKYDLELSTRRVNDTLVNDIDDKDEEDEVTLEAFDLREEAETGDFDKDMNYVRKDNNEDEEWMNAKSSEIAKAHEAQLRRRQQKKHVAAPTDILLSEIISILEPAESPMEALARLAPAKSRKNRKKTVLDPERKKTVLSLTESCEQLLNENGITNIYDATREELMRAYKRETGTEFTQKRQKRSRENTQWEFRWIGDDDWHGPHTDYEMKYWKENYFEDNVEVRPVGTTETQHVSAVEFNDDDDDDPDP